MLDRLPVVDPLHRAVNPPETQSHLHRIHVADYPWAVLSRTVDPNPEVTDLLVVI